MNLPKVINAQDIKKLFEVTTNLKHNTMLKLCYGMGLRVSEIVSLKIMDIDSKNMQVLIEKAKGKKDRYANLPLSILEQLRVYFKEYQKPFGLYRIATAYFVLFKNFKNCFIVKLIQLKYSLSILYIIFIKIIWLYHLVFYHLLICTRYYVYLRDQRNPPPQYPAGFKDSLGGECVGFP